MTKNRILWNGHINKSHTFSYFPRNEEHKRQMCHESNCIFCIKLLAFCRSAWRSYAMVLLTTATTVTASDPSLLGTQEGTYIIGFDFPLLSILLAMMVGFVRRYVHCTYLLLIGKQMQKMLIVSSKSRRVFTFYTDIVSCVVLCSFIPIEHSADNIVCRGWLCHS